MIILLLAAPSLASTLTVDPADQTAHATIQAAIDASAPGDTIEVAAGTYAECILTPEQELTIVGAGSDTTTLACDGSQRAARLFGAVSLSGFTITNVDQGCVRGGGDITLDQVVLSGCGTSSIHGGAIELTTGTLTLSDSTVLDGTGNSGVVFLNQGTSASVSHTTFQGGLAQRGGAIHAIQGASVALDTVTFDDNSSSWEGGAVYLHRATLDSHSSIWSGNKAGAAHFGGGGAYMFFASASFTEDIFAGNGSGTAMGGALSVMDSSVELDRVALSSNSTILRGGAISMSGGTVDIVNSTFAGNQSKTAGSIFSEFSPGSSGSDALTIRDTTFDGDVASSGGGGSIVVNGVAVELEAVRVRGASASGLGGGMNINYGPSATLTDVTFDGNIASQGGGLYATSLRTLTITDGTFTGNQATNGPGGGIFWAAGAGTSAFDLALVDTVLTDNSATGHGGGLHVVKPRTLTIQGSTFSNNLSGETSSGGALHLLDATTATVTHNTFCENRAQSGGAVHTSGASTTDEWRHNFFIGNEATEGGALYVLSSPEWTFVNNTLAGNAATSGTALYAASSTVGFVNNVVASGRGGAAAHAADTETGAASTFAYNNWFDNTATDVGGSFAFATSTNGNISANPDFVAFTDDGDCTNDALWPRIGSPLVDAGDPSITDPDDSRSDIGATGGSQAVGYDFDADGADHRTDCDDTDPAVFPEASELCDDVDNDCDGDIDEDPDDAPTWYADADADGFGDSTAPLVACTQPTGYVSDDADCDDDDADAFPGADGYALDCTPIDRDTDSEDSGDPNGGDVGDVGDGSCGCTSGSGSPLTLLTGLLAAIAVRRRGRYSKA